MPSLKVDHFVLFVPDLQKAIRFFEEHLHILPLMGGKHLDAGTHNALLGLGSPEDRVYLELFAIDPEDKTPYHSYPLGLSKNIEDMYFCSWCLRCDQETNIVELNQSMKNLGPEYNLGELRKMQRIMPSGLTLSWQLASTPEQAIISKGQIPFLIQWGDLSLHPSTHMLPTQFIPYALHFAGPESNKIQRNLFQLGFLGSKYITFSDTPHTTIKLSLYGNKKTLTFRGRPDTPIFDHAHR